MILDLPKQLFCLVSEPDFPLLEQYHLTPAADVELLKELPKVFGADDLEDLFNLR